MQKRIALFEMFLFVMGVMVAGASAQSADVAAKPNGGKFKIAVLSTFYGNHSHANALATKFFTGYPSDEGVIEPKVEVVSMFVDQPKPDDVAHQLAEKYGFKVWPTITEALTLGGKQLAVDGVIYIGVHGEYPRSRMGAKMYPHLRHLEEVFAVFDASGKSVPVYCDKELGYRWGDAKWIYDRAKELNAPLMAGSTLPVVWRDPQIPTPNGQKITEAVSVGYGPLNSYLMHNVEILQSMLENRAGGETGISSVQCVSGANFYKAAEEGKFSMELVEKACATIKGKKPGTMRDHESNPVGIIINFHDGTRATAVSAARYVGENFAYAANMEGQTVATQFALPHNYVFPHFSYLFFNVERMLETGQPAWPSERNLLSAGIIDAAMHSLKNNGEVLQTPHLDIDYKPAGPEFIRPQNPQPTGDSLAPWPPKGFEFSDWAK